MAAQHSPAMARRAGHAAQRVGEAGRDDEDGEHLKEVREAASGSRRDGRCWR